jgi:hypothetical protein
MLAGGLQQPGDQHHDLGEVIRGVGVRPALAVHGHLRLHALDGKRRLRRPEHEAPVEDVGGDDRLEIAGRPADVHQLDGRRHAGDRIARAVGVRVAGHVASDPDADLRLRLELGGVAAGVPAAGLELRRRGEEADHRLAQPQLLLDLGDVQADLPTHAPSASLELRAPGLELLVQAVEDLPVDVAHGDITILRASLRS